MINELAKKIAADSGMDEQTILNKISEKQEELSGLISEEGAAHIVAKELGVSLLRRQEKLNIENVVPGMQNVDVIGKIVKIFSVREFATEKAKGRVLNMILADSTGSVRVSFWNDEIDKIREFSIGDVVRVRGFVRDNQGEPEIRLGRFGNIQRSDEDVEVKYERKAERSAIAQLGEGQFREVRACLLQVFESNIFYEVCPQCRSHLSDGVCKEHGKVEPDYGMIVSGIIDDGSDNMRIVFFNENAEKVLKMSKEDAKRVFDHRRNASDVLKNVSYGEYIFEGRVKRNSFFDRLEMIANNVRSVDVTKEIELMLNG